MLGETGPQSLQLRQWVADRLRAEILEGQLCPGEWLRQERLRASTASARRRCARRSSCSPRRGWSSTCRTAASGWSSFARGCRGPLRDARPGRGPGRPLCGATDLARRGRRAGASPPGDGGVRHPARPGGVPRAQPALPRFIFRAAALLPGADARPAVGGVPHHALEQHPAGRRTSAPGRDEPDTVEHAEIVAALGGRNPDRAERAVRYHIEAAGEPLVAAMKAQP